MNGDRTQHPTHPAGFTRRRVLGAGIAAVVLAACGDGGSDTDAASTSTVPGDDTSAGEQAAATTTTASSPASPPAQAALTAADFAALGTCVLVPEQTAGPFPLDQQFDRRDVTEGYPGHPLRLGFRVLDEGCAPVPGATVEIWHCDATGDYSAFADGGGGKDEAGGTTFLRGSQTADDQGIVEFLTIVPGWYPGRAVHIHLRVHLDDTIVLTGQVYFDAALLTAVYAEEPYAQFGEPDTPLERDAIGGDAENEGTILHAAAAETSAGSGTLALLNLGIDPAAT